MNYIDLETIPNAEAIASDAWLRKKAKAEKAGKPIDDHDASFCPVFGEILCIVACNDGENGWETFDQITSETVTEKDLLENFLEWWSDCTGDDKGVLCAHFGKGFDFTFLTKRLLHHGIELPYVLRIAGKKPWEIKHVDTMEVLQFGDFKNHTSLDAACYLLGIPTPKEGIDGSMVWQAHKDGRDKEILSYCRRDVQALVSVVKRLKKLGAME